MMNFIGILRRLNCLLITHRPVSVLIGGLLASFVLIAPLSAQTYQGFGADTPGGTGQPVYHVTNLNDSGPGSLRDAVFQGNRHVVFDVAGEIVLASKIPVRGSFVTIDGLSAPAPGITLRNAGLNISGLKGAHDVIVRGIRVRDSAEDGIQVVDGAYNIVIDHVSIDGSADGNIDIGTGSHDVTVSWSILYGSDSNMLIKFNPSRVTLHHNLFAHSIQRNPQVRIDNNGGVANDTTLDMRNNLVWDWAGGSGTLVWHGPWANVVENYYAANGGDAPDALIVSDGARAFLTNNFSLDGLNVNIGGTELAPFAAAAVDTADACVAAHAILAGAGVTPRDALEQQHLAEILLPPPPCARPRLTQPAPGSVLGGSAVTFEWSPEGKKVNSWRLMIGSTQGENDLYDSGNLQPSRLSRTVQKLPLDGRTIWVRLRFSLNGQQFSDYKFTAALR
jgi:hypothetical protein